MTDKKDVQMLRGILELLVSDPKKIKIERKIDELGVLITFEVAKEDVGTVIGKKGSNINAIRQLVSTIGYQNKSKVCLKFNAPEKKSFGEANATVDIDDLKI